MAKHIYKIRVFGECNYHFVGTGREAKKIEIEWTPAELYTGDGNYKSEESARKGIARKIRAAEKRGGWRNCHGEIYTS